MAHLRRLSFVLLYFHNDYSLHILSKPHRTFHNMAMRVILTHKLIITAITTAAGMSRGLLPAGDGNGCSGSARHS